MDYRITVTVEVPVHPTETTDRVRETIEQLFPEAQVTAHIEQTDAGYASGTLVATTESLATLSERFHRQQILDTARERLLDGLDPETNTITFRCKKQAATQGVVNFAVGTEAELGDLYVRISIDDPTPEAFVDHIAPPTQDGVPIDTPERKDESP